MNYSKPILICDQNEDFRILIRDMLTKNGFFHILEAADDKEALAVLAKNKDYFVLVESNTLTAEMTSVIKNSKSYVIFAESGDSKTLSIAAKLGVEHLICYPFHSKKLIQKMNELI